MKNSFSPIKSFCITSLFVISSINAAPDPNFHIYLLFGQSNMAGGGNTAGLNQQDCDTTSRAKVLAFCDCPNLQLCPNTGGRTKDKWYTAVPPLHICSEGVSPGDYFAKTMLDSIHEDISIGLIPCALSGQSINVFKKGTSGIAIPNWAHPTLGSSSAYEWMLNRCKIAQESGVIKGILFHQGESDNGQSTWINTTKTIFDNLKNDLTLDDNIPVVVGELVQDGACCSGHNTLVNQLASEYPHCAVASSNGLKRKDQYHFNIEGMREMGKRFANAILSLSDNTYIPRKGTVHIKEFKNSAVASGRSVRSWNGDLVVYSLDGKILTVLNSKSSADAWFKMRKRKAFIVSHKVINDAQMVVIP